MMKRTTQLKINILEIIDIIIDKNDVTKIR